MNAPEKITNSNETAKPNSKEALELLEQQTATIIAPMGYDVVAIESSSAPGAGRTISLFIDFTNTISDDGTEKRIGLDDCLAVNTAVDQLFETTPLLDGSYTFDVSSPGVERPLRKIADFERFKGRKVRAHTYRALDADELGNATYWEKNKKQKNFVGKLEGVLQDKIMINVDGKTVSVPMALISKAHLEYCAPDGATIRTRGE